MNAQGGGTPTYLDKRTISRLVALLREPDFLLDTEMSIEVDPREDENWMCSIILRYRRRL